MTTILKNRKTAITPEQFDQSAQNLARWRKLALRTGAVVKLKSKMADGRHVDTLKNCHIATTVWPIGMKFGRVMHIGHSNR